MQKYQEVFNRIKEIIKKVNDYGQPIKYDDNYMKIVSIFKNNTTVLGLKFILFT